MASVLVNDFIGQREDDLLLECLLQKLTTVEL